jgi:hypothetical protein
MGSLFVFARARLVVEGDGGGVGGGFQKRRFRV